MYEIFEEKEVTYGRIDNQELFYFKGDETKRIRIKNDEGFHVIHDLEWEHLPGEVYAQSVVMDDWSGDGYNRPCIVIKLRWKTC
jgi:hypothetical protein